MPFIFYIFFELVTCLGLSSDWQISCIVISCTQDKSKFRIFSNIFSFQNADTYYQYNKHLYVSSQIILSFICLFVRFAPHFLAYFSRVTVLNFTYDSYTIPNITTAYSCQLEVFFNRWYNFILFVCYIFKEG